MKKAKYFVGLHLFLVVFSLLGIASKLASGESFLSFRFCLFYGIALLNLFIYAIVWQQIIKKIPLVTAYANKAVTIVWGIVWGYLFFHEQITVSKIAGALIVIIGVVVVVISDREERE